MTTATLLLPPPAVHTAGWLDSAMRSLRLTHMVLLFAAFVLFFGLVGGIGFKVLADAAIEKETLRLDSISALKAQEVTAWWQERRDDISLLASNQVFRDLLSPAHVRAADPKAERLAAWHDDQRLTLWLEESRKIHNFRSAEVVAPSGRALISAGSAPYSDVVIRPVVAAALRSQQMEFLDITLGHDGQPYMAFAARIPTVLDQAPLVLVFTVDLSDGFVAMVDKWPNTTRTGELLLLRVEHARVSVLNRPPPVPGELVGFALTDPRTPVAQALARGDGVYAGRDYNGREVFASVRHVRGLPWLVTARIQAVELLEPITNLALVCASLTLLGVAACGGLLMLFWRQNQLRLAEAAGLNLALAQRSAEAAQAARAKSTFLASMSHEIRTPLNAIVGMTHLLLRRAGPGSWEHDKLTQVNRSAQHLLGIINDVLDVSRIEAGKLQLDEIDFRLDELLHDKVCSLIGQRAREKDIELVLDIDPALAAPLHGDPLRIAQAMLNYASNAIKFTEAGRVVLRARLQAVDDAGLLVRLEVSDTGIGLTAEQIKRLFNPFEQADSSTTRRFGGSGLGLTITARLAALMGGEVGVESVPGVGSRFWLTVRLHHAAVPQGGASASGSMAPVLLGRRVLVADDLPEARAVLVTMLRSLGMRPAEAADANEALQAVRVARAEGDPFGLVVLDWRMPGPPALATVAQLRLDSPGGAPDVLLVSAYDDALFDPAVQADPRLPVLRKPVTASAVVDALANLRGSGRPVVAPAPSRAADALAGLARGRRVIVAEDNLVNRELMVELLAEFDLHLDLAADGLEAVALGRAGVPDLVLMDMQMPGMDGLQATVALRQLPGWQGVPIIAMTANAFAEDRAACIAAGMNDHIGKPVEPDLLYATLARWLGARTPAPAAPTPDGSALVAVEAAPPAPAHRQHGDQDDEPVLFDLAEFSRITLGRMPAMQRIARHFIAHHAQDMDTLARLLYAAQWQQASRITHAIKGSSAQIGAVQLHLAAAALDVTLRAQQAPSPDDVAHLTDVCARTLVCMQAWLDSQGADPTGSAPATADGGAAASTETGADAGADVAAHAAAHAVADTVADAAAAPLPAATALQMLHDLHTLLRASDGRAVELAEQLAARAPAVLSLTQRAVLAGLAVGAGRFDFETTLTRLQAALPDLEDTLS